MTYTTLRDISAVAQRTHESVVDLNRLVRDFKYMAPWILLTSAYCFSPNPLAFGPSLQPKLGKLGATTWNETPLLLCLSAASIFVTSM